MAYLIQINGMGPQPFEMPINEDSMTVGSSSTCNCRIDHAEVESRALQLDVRGGDFWVQNCNPYPIYVGDSEVGTDSWAPWGTNEAIQLTRTISLNIVEREDVAASDKSEDEVDESKKPAGNAGKMFQVIAIVGCLGLAVVFLMGGGDREGKDNEKTAKFDFNDVITRLSSKESEIEYRTLRSYLQQAWKADRRWAKSDSEAVAKFYQLVASHRLIRVNQSREEDRRDETLSEIHILAEERLDDLGN